MSEITKLYENAGIKKNWKPTPYGGIEEYSPPFTAEKQIELIKLLMEQEDFSWTITQQGKVIEYAFYVGYEYSSGDFKEFAEALAGIINNLWQDLAEEERKQIKEILE